MFEVGDLVRLKGSFFVVVVSEIMEDDEKIEILWWNNNTQEFQDMVYPTACFEKVGEQ